MTYTITWCVRLQYGSLVSSFVLILLGAEMPHAPRAAAHCKRLLGLLVVVDEVNCDVVVVAQQSVPNHVCSLAIPERHDKGRTA